MIFTALPKDRGVRGGAKIIVSSISNISNHRKINDACFPQTSSYHPLTIFLTSHIGYF